MLFLVPILIAAVGVPVVAGYVRYRDQRKSLERWLTPPERSLKRHVEERE